MQDDWKSTTDRALSNTEMILRNLDQSRGAGVRKPAQRSSWFGHGPTHVSFESFEQSARANMLEQQLLDVTAQQQYLVQKSSLQTDLENFFSMQKSALMNEFDRCLAEIRAEADSFSVRNQRIVQDTNLAAETLRSQIKEETLSKVNSVQDEMEDLRRRVTDDREKRCKLEKQVNGMHRWQDEAKYIIEDLQHKTEQLEEARGADRRETRKDLQKRGDEINEIKQAGSPFTPSVQMNATATCPCRH
jgi:hypothetical protein